MPTPAGFQIGDVIADKFRIERILGAGGMGVVVAARHLSLDDVVAIKFLSAELANDATAVSRFDREARAAAKIKSEHVVRVFDVGRLSNGAPYMVMEHLEGSDLSQLIRAGAPLTESEAADLALQTAAALAEAHRLGIVHRDIKPSNLFRTPRAGGSSSLKVLDFGISKLTLTADSANGSITGTAAAIGSPSYMSPEQMRSASRVDARTDIWSLGVVLYELLTGTLPFRAATYPELCLKVAGDPPEPPRLHRPGLSPAMEALILRCLAKDADQRFPTVLALAEALLPFSPGSAHVLARVRDGATGASSAPPQPSREAYSTAPLIATASAPRAASPITASTWTRTALPRSRARWLGVGAGLAFGALAAGGGALWLSGRGDSAPATAAGPSSGEAPSVAATAGTPPAPLPAPEPSAATTASAGVATSLPSASAPKASSARAPAVSPPRTPSIAAKPTPPGATSATPTSTSATSKREKNAVWNQRD